MTKTSNLPALCYPAFYASHAGLWIATPDGESYRVSQGKALRATIQTPHIVLHAPLTAKRLGCDTLSGLDLLELYAFLYPTDFAVPTTAGLAAAIGLAPPADEAQTAALLLDIAHRMLVACRSPAWSKIAGASASLAALTQLGWSWAPIVSDYLGDYLETDPEKNRPLFAGLAEWEDSPPCYANSPATLDKEDIHARLATIVGEHGEHRQGQRDYAEDVAHIFEPRQRKGSPNFLLAEAGTGIGKTLAYLTPAKLWIEQSGGSLTIATFTKALQRQLAKEAQRLYPAPQAAAPSKVADETEKTTKAATTESKSRARKIVVRKGRENYLCLLNLEEALQARFAGRIAIFAQLVARWAMFTDDGDMDSGDFHGWLPSLFQRNLRTALTDRRGECIYTACAHYRRCFIERSIRAAEQADIIIANHALMLRRARAEDGAPSRLIIDEGHHLFDVADSVFAVNLTIRNAMELRRWIRGTENQMSRRQRGLAKRLGDVASYDSASHAAIRAIVRAAHALPAPPAVGSIKRLIQGEPEGAIEHLLAECRVLTYARTKDSEHSNGYGLECAVRDIPAALHQAAEQADCALEAILQPLHRLGVRLEEVLDEAPDWLDAQAYARIEGACHGIAERYDMLVAWKALLDRIIDSTASSAAGGTDVDRTDIDKTASDRTAAETTTRNRTSGVSVSNAGTLKRDNTVTATNPADFVDWFAVDRIDGREYDCGIYRRWLDPMQPLAEVLYKPAHGVLVTSATLRTGGAWDDAELRTGALHLDTPARHFAVDSPFTYSDCCEVMIVTDLAHRPNMAVLAEAYARLIEAAGGGVLGLFTAIRRLQAVQQRIADRLANSGLPLYTQHVDPLDTGTLVDIFRADSRVSLLGSDALRDGIDVVGESLRLVVMESVPWQRRTILHAARKQANGGGAYDDMIARGRMAQAFGRLIRSQHDRGQFVLLSSAVPSRLLSAFPVPVQRVTMEQAIARVQTWNSD